MLVMSEDKQIASQLQFKNWQITNNIKKKERNE